MYPSTSNTLPLIIATLNPTNLLLVNACTINKASEILNSAVKRPLAAIEGIYSQYERPSEHVSKVQAARHAFLISKLSEKHAAGAV
jgi:hypothetical protein